MRCEFGFCLSCDKEIAPQCDGCTGRRPNEHYTEVTLPLSNGSKMNVGVCTGCAEHTIWKADKKALMDAVKAAWDKTPGAVYDKDVSFV